ncbi:MAG: hypothetical protein M1480_15935 [Bacteroidetes bacterium]|nr:hypothetical protein [Bacteroidota bacterium]
MMIEGCGDLRIDDFRICDCRIEEQIIKPQMNKNELKERTKRFAHDCVKLALKLPNTFLGNHIKGQLIRCSTETKLVKVEKLLSGLINSFN